MLPKPGILGQDVPEEISAHTHDENGSLLFKILWKTNVQTGYQAMASYYGGRLLSAYYPELIERYNKSRSNINR